jgi:hypothetical protein
MTAYEIRIRKFPYFRGATVENGQVVGGVHGTEFIVECLGYDEVWDNARWCKRIMISPLDRADSLAGAMEIAARFGKHLEEREDPQ